MMHRLQISTRGATLLSTAVAATVCAVVGARRLARRSGVTAADLVAPMPGDELVERPDFVVDRAMGLPAPPAAVWPWLVQLGKGRAWWYLPAWAERFVWARDKRGARRIIPELQALAVGDAVPDWGPGDPVFRVVELDPTHALVYHSLRQRSNQWRWPEPDTPRPPDSLELSWALVLAPLPGGCARLHIRLRVTGVRRAKLLIELGGGLIDYVTIVLLFSGLSERLTTPRAKQHGAGPALAKWQTRLQHVAATQVSSSTSRARASTLLRRVAWVDAPR